MFRPPDTKYLYMSIVLFFDVFYYISAIYLLVYVEYP